MVPPLLQKATTKIFWPCKSGTTLHLLTHVCIYVRIHILSYGRLFYVHIGIPFNNGSVE